MPFQIAGKLRCRPTDNGFIQVQSAYLALISNLDKLIQHIYQLVSAAKYLLAHTYNYDNRTFSELVMNKIISVFKGLSV